MDYTPTNQGSAEHVVQFNKLPIKVQSDIREFVRDNPRLYDGITKVEDDSTWGVIDALDAYLQWNGVIGWTRTIYAIFEAANKGEQA